MVLDWHGQEFANFEASGRHLAAKSAIKNKRSISVHGTFCYMSIHIECQVVELRSVFGVCVARVDSVKDGGCARCSSSAEAFDTYSIFLSNRTLARCINAYIIGIEPSTTDLSNRIRWQCSYVVFRSAPGCPLLWTTRLTGKQRSCIVFQPAHGQNSGCFQV